MRRIALGLPENDGQAAIALNAALARYWLEHVCQGTGAPVLPSATDIARMGKDLLRLFREICGPDPLLHDISANEIAIYAARRRGEPQRRYKRPPKGQETIPLCGPRTVNAEIEHLRAVVTMARDTWHRTVDPEIATDRGERRRVPVNFDALLFAEPDSPRASVAVDAQARVIEFCARPENLEWAHVADLLQVGIWEQPRRGNLVTLDWSQIDMAARCYTLATKSAKPGGEIIRIEMTAAFWRWLAARHPQASGRVFLRWNPYAKKVPIAASEGAPHRARGQREYAWQGAWVPFDEFKRAWATVRRECGLGAITFHQATRKTGGTRILDAGGSLADAQLALGHKDIRTTMRYLNVTAGTARAAKDAAAGWYESQLRHSGAPEAADEAAGAPVKPAKSTA